MLLRSKVGKERFAPKSPTLAPNALANDDTIVHQISDGTTSSSVDSTSSESSTESSSSESDASSKTPKTTKPNPPVKRKPVKVRGPQSFHVKVLVNTPFLDAGCVCLHTCQAAFLFPEVDVLHRTAVLPLKTHASMHHGPLLGAASLSSSGYFVPFSFERWRAFQMTALGVTTTHTPLHYEKVYPRKTTSGEAEAAYSARHHQR